MFEKLTIPNTLAAGPGPGNTDPRVLEQFSKAGLADHMHPDVLRGMKECKFMLREVWGTKNIHTFGVAGTGWSGLDAVISAVKPGDKVVAFVNGTFSGIDALSIRMKAATEEELVSNPLDPDAKSVKVVNVPHGQSVDGDIIEQYMSAHKPKWAFMAHYETGSGRVNDIEAFSESCARYGALGLIDAVSSLGVGDFKIDDYPGVVAWASCPQKGISCLPLTYAPVSFSDEYIDVLKAGGARTFVHNPILEARHWAIIEDADADKGTYHRTHSAYAVAAFHEALRLTLQEGISNRAAKYVKYEKVLSGAFRAMGCDVTSDMTSLVVLNLPENLSGREMEFVQNCRSENFGIWPTLSEPVQVRVGILNLLKDEAVSEIIIKFGSALKELGGQFDDKLVTLEINKLSNKIAAE
ncbi:aminotransferase class V-fold PLP-dependent enzyme [Rhodobacteraceae bacterium]|nr:aminotransferase class V-fold PLP-dependent enzyme [Paracoccaceae bacterium]